MRHDANETHDDDHGRAAYPQPFAARALDRGVNGLVQSPDNGSPGGEY